MPYTNDTKPTTTYANDTKPSTTWDNGLGYILKEDTFYLLLESGFKIILDQSNNAMPTTSYTNDTKP